MEVERRRPGGLYLLLAVAVTLWVMAALCACPGCWFWEDNYHPGNEASAISALRTISSAQELYKTRTGTYGDYFDLNNGRDKKYTDPALAKADPDHPHHQDKSGYNVDICVSPDRSDWYAIAMPGNWGRDGERNFKITSDGIIYWNETERSVVFKNVLGRP
jgi:hypothetical protein